MPFFKFHIHAKLVISTYIQSVFNQTHVMFALKPNRRWSPAVWWVALLWLGGCERWDLPRQPIDLSAGLVAYYPLNGNSLDASGNNLNGQTLNGATYGPDRTLKTASALVLDGVDDYFEIPDNVKLRPDAISISLWIKPRRVTSTCHLYNKSTYSTHENQQYSALIRPPYGIGDGKGPGVELLADLNQDGSCALELPLKQPVSYYDPVFQLDSWHHFVTVFTGTTGKIYLDGELKRVDTALPNAPMDPCTGGNLRFGAQAAIDLNPFDGSMDELRIYNRALSETEVKALYRQ